MFVLYTQFSRARRDLKKLIQQAKDGQVKEPGALDIQRERFNSDAGRVLDSLVALGAQAVVVKKRA